MRINRTVPLFFVIMMSLLLSAMSDVCAAEDRLVVLPFVSKHQDQKALCSEATDSMIEEVKKVKDCRYVSEDELYEGWLGSSRDKDGKVLGLAAMDDIKAGADMRLLFDPDSAGTIHEKMDLWKVDLAIHGTMEKAQDNVSLMMQFISIDTGKFVMNNAECRPDEVKQVVAETVRSVLKNKDAVKKVEADKVVDPIYSKVEYAVKTDSGSPCSIVVDYTSDRINPPVQDVKLVFPKGVPAGAAAGLFTETLSMVSDAGYIINAEFQWNKDQLKSVRIMPLTNPYKQVIDKQPVARDVPLTSGAIPQSATQPL